MACAPVKALLLVLSSCHVLTTKNLSKGRHIADNGDACIQDLKTGLNSLGWREKEEPTQRSHESGFTIVCHTGRSPCVFLLTSRELDTFAKTLDPNQGFELQHILVVFQGKEELTKAKVMIVEGRKTYPSLNFLGLVEASNCRSTAYASKLHEYLTGTQQHAIVRRNVDDAVNTSSSQTAGGNVLRSTTVQAGTSEASSTEVGNVLSTMAAMNSLSGTKQGITSSTAVKEGDVTQTMYVATTMHMATTVHVATTNHVTDITIPQSTDVTGSKGTVEKVPTLTTSVPSTPLVKESFFPSVNPSAGQTSSASTSTEMTNGVRVMLTTAVEKGLQTRSLATASVTEGSSSSKATAASSSLSSQSVTRKSSITSAKPTTMSSPFVSSSSLAFVTNLLPSAYSSSSSLVTALVLPVTSSFASVQSKSSATSYEVATSQAKMVTPYTASPGSILMVTTPLTHKTALLSAAMTVSGSSLQALPSSIAKTSTFIAPSPSRTSSSSSSSTYVYTTSPMVSITPSQSSSLRLSPSPSPSPTKPLTRDFVFKLKLDANCSLLNNTTLSTNLETQLVDDVVKLLNVSKNDVQVQLSCGSIIASFTVKSPPPDAETTLSREFNKTYSVQVGGKNITAVEFIVVKVASTTAASAISTSTSSRHSPAPPATSSKSPTSASASGSPAPTTSLIAIPTPSATPTPKPKEKDLAFILYVAIGSVVGVILLVIIIVAIVSCRRNATKGAMKISDKVDYELGSFQSIPRAKVKMYGAERESKPEPDDMPYTGYPEGDVDTRLRVQDEGDLTGSRDNLVFTKDSVTGIDNPGLVTDEKSGAS